VMTSSSLPSFCSTRFLVSNQESLLLPKQQSFRSIPIFTEIWNKIPLAKTLRSRCILGHPHRLIRLGSFKFCWSQWSPRIFPIYCNQLLCILHVHHDNSEGNKLGGGSTHVITSLINSSLSSPEAHNLSFADFLRYQKSPYSCFLPQPTPGREQDRHKLILAKALILLRSESYK